ncbi:hypothetical protein OH492_23080 [Vibrio chagasii]|nr:hypothetical protein [Vibrio chagasii]
MKIKRLKQIETNHRELDVIEASDGVLHGTFAQLCPVGSKPRMIILNCRAFTTRFSWLMYYKWARLPMTQQDVLSRTSGRVL